jgi:hypothetical protein
MNLPPIRGMNIYILVDCAGNFNRSFPVIVNSDNIRREGFTRKIPCDIMTGEGWMRFDEYI